MINFEIKYYQDNYKLQLLQVWESSVLHTHHFLSANHFSKIKELLYSFDFKILNIDCLFLQNKLIGFSAINHTKLEMLFVDKDFIGKGFGKLLLKHALDKYAIDTVEVNEQNQSAFEFYQRAGFQIIERKEIDDFELPYPILKMKLNK